jgi:hypothetical protein
VIGRARVDLQFRAEMLQSVEVHTNIVLVARVAAPQTTHRPVWMDKLVVDRRGAVVWGSD